MKKLKEINGFFYFIVLGCLVLNFIDDAFNAHVFKFISETKYWNFVGIIFFIFFGLSIVSLLKKELIFKLVPRFIYIVYIIITLISFF
jgi:hypothetical protein